MIPSAVEALSRLRSWTTHSNMPAVRFRRLAVTGLANVRWCGWGRFAVPSGVDVKTVSAILGHSNAAMTLNVYADALADSKKVSMDLMGRIMSAGLS
jgi:integrase